MKKTIKLTESELISVIKKSVNEHKLVLESSDMEQEALSAWQSESEENKKKFLKVLIECLGERNKTIDRKGNVVEKGKHGWRLLGEIVLTLGSPALAFYLFLKSMGPVDQPQGPVNPVETIGGIGAMISTVFGLKMTLDEIEQIKKCVKQKMNNPGVSSDENIKESKMKKTIRLTESELIKLVQKIIKEDEMMGEDLPFPIKKTVQDIINTKRFNTLQEGMMVTIKNNKLTIRPGGSEFNEEYVINLSPKGHKDLDEQQTKIKVISGKLVIKLISGENIILEPSQEVLKFKL
jgi:hypothetical protein